MGLSKAVWVRGLIAFVFLVALGASAAAACTSSTITPAPDPVPTTAPAPVPSPPPAPPTNANAQGVQASLSLSVPNFVAPGPTPGVWVASSLVRVGSLQLSSAATAADRVVLVGTDDNTLPVLSGTVLYVITGGQGVVPTPTPIGIWGYYSSLRAAGPTAGLRLTLLGDDGSGGSGTIVTANQGLPNVIGDAWPTEITTDGVSVAGTAAHPFRVDPTGTTAQPVSGTLTCNVGTTNGLALDATLTGGNEKTQVVTSDGSQLFPVAAAPADATANGNVTALACRSEAFNGATWDLLRSGQTAVTSTTTGILDDMPFAQFKATPTTKTDGQIGPLLSDASGNLRITNAPATSVHSTALEATHVLSTTAQSFVSAMVQIDATAGTATYYVQVVQTVAGACPVDGAVTLVHAPITVVHTNGKSDVVNYDDSGGPIAFSPGACAVCSTTQFTKTAAGAVCTFDASIR